MYDVSLIELPSEGCTELPVLIKWNRMSFVWIASVESTTVNSQQSTVSGRSVTTDVEAESDKLTHSVTVEDTFYYATVHTK